MARGSATADTAAKSAQGLSNQFSGNAQTGFNELMPELQTEVAHPAGYNPTDLARMQTGVEQSAGGANAGAVGQGALLASRTKNPGTAAAAIPAAARAGQEEASKGMLGVNTANAALRERQRQAGLSGLQGLTTAAGGQSIGALGEVAPNVNASTNAQNASWDWANYILDPALGAAGRAAPQIANALGAH